VSWRANRLAHEVIERYVAARGGAIPPGEAEAVVQHVLPLARAVVRYEKAVSSRGTAVKKQRKAAIKAAKQSLRQAEKRREAVQKMNGTYRRRSMNDGGYANGHRLEPSYSAYPYWHHPGGRSGKQPES
jgi:hypothetical protein